MKRPGLLRIEKERLEATRWQKLGNQTLESLTGAIRASFFITHKPVNYRELEQGKLQIQGVRAEDVKDYVMTQIGLHQDEVAVDPETKICMYKDAKNNLILAYIPGNNPNYMIMFDAPQGLRRSLPRLKDGSDLPKPVHSPLKPLYDRGKFSYRNVRKNYGTTKSAAR